MRQKYFRMEDQKFGLVCKQHVAKGEDWNQKLRFSKYVLRFIVEAQDE